jgi:hypothetical protein
LKISNFISASDPGITDDEVKENLTKDKGDSIMMTFDISSSMRFIHSITNLGGTNFIPADKLVTLDGFKSKNALPIILNFESLNNIFESDIPNFNNIKSITSPEEVSNLQTGNTSFHNHPFMLLPLFLWDSISLIKNHSNF